MSGSNLIVGAHTSAAGGVHNALLHGKKIGAGTVQLFTANQRQWKSRPIPEEEVALFKKTAEETGLKNVMSHDSYLINLGAPNEENLIKSRQAFKEEIDRCLALGLSFLNFHPGASLNSSAESCMDCIVESLLQLEALNFGNLRLLLEATAGQGSTVGWKFEQLSYIIDRVKHKIPIGVCIDTCHIFVAGYDIRTAEAWDSTLKEFDRAVGLQHLYAFHLNDSLKGLGSKVDRHQPLGKGTIGLDSFRFLVNDSRTKHLPMYLETPDGMELWEKEIALLKEMTIN